MNTVKLPRLAGGEWIGVDNTVPRCCRRAWMDFAATTMSMSSG
jgi:hypothetical protein